MIDTVAAIINPPRRIDDAVFDGVNVRMARDDTQPRTRLWINDRPSVTYWRADDPRDEGRLRVEWSMYSVLGKTGVCNLTADEIDRALDLVNEHIKRVVGQGLPDVREWRCNRIDYCYNWVVGAEGAAYLDVLSRLRLRTYERHPFETGVVWKSRGRWVKFYDKAVEERNGWGVLRMEVSNFRDAVRYMCKSWACDRTVGDLCAAERSLSCLSSHMELLGLGEQLYGGDDVLVWRLRDAFGTGGVARAQFMLSVIQEYGSRAYQEDVMLCARSTYYHWKRKLSDAGFLTSGGGGVVYKRLAPLLLPSVQNLGSSPPLAAKHGQKNSPEIEVAL